MALPVRPPPGQVMGIPVRHIPMLTAELSSGAPLFQPAAAQQAPGQGAGAAGPGAQLAAGVLQPASGLRSEHLSVYRQEAQLQPALGVPAWLASSAAAAVIPEPPPPSVASSASAQEAEEAWPQASSAAAEARAARRRL